MAPRLLCLASLARPHALIPGKNDGQLDNAMMNVVPSMKINPPVKCASNGPHKAERQVWRGENALHDARLASEHDCYVVVDDWKKQWRRFKRVRGYSLCLCEMAFEELRSEAKRVGLIW